MRAALFIALALAWTPLVAAPAFTTAERQAILAHGPWPPPLEPDPSNRVSGQPAAIALGDALFHDFRLSRTGDAACAYCHDPAKDFAGSDTIARVVRVKTRTLYRNTQSLWNVRFNRWFGWAGAVDTLWGASIRPILAHDEMDADPERIARLLTDDAWLAGLYARAFGRDPVGVARDALVVDAGKALAAYQETLVSPRSAFDAFRDALAAGDAAGVAAYPAAARRGARLFVGEGRCNLCHAGQRFTHGEFEDAGVPYFIRPGLVDPGRHGGLKAFKASPYRRDGAHSDAPDSPAARLTANVRMQHRDWGAFRVPSLRRVARTPPYMHDGSLATLEDVARHYSELDEERLHADGAAILRPLKLTQAEIDDLVAFLKTL